MNIKEAIQVTKNMFIDYDYDFENFGTFPLVNFTRKEAIETVLAELEKKDKVINKMAERLTTDIHSKEWVINYYEREVEEDK